jgi:hypothetical protein
MTNDLVEWDAAYVLGALSPADRRTYENYLAAKPARGAELAELAGLPGVLNVLNREEAVALLDTAGEAPVARAPDLMPSLACAAAKRQRRSRRVLCVAALTTAAALLVAGGIVGAKVFARSTPPSQTVAMQAMQPTPRGGIEASLAVTDKKWGTRLDWSCQYTKDWSKHVKLYDIVVTKNDGIQMPVASWSPAGDEASGLAASTGTPTSQIRSIDIRVAATQEPLAITTLQ